MIRKLKYLFFVLPLIGILTFGCSQNKNTFINRGYHNVTSKYNGYYNGREKIRQTLKSQKVKAKEDYKKLLPIFLGGGAEEATGMTANMDVAIEKCSRVVYLHSMDIKGKEYCKWIDDTWLVIGQANYYKGEYYKARKIFEYMGKEYKNSDMKSLAKIWISKCYKQDKKYYDAERILKEIKSDGVAEEHKLEFSLVYADFFINQKMYEEAIPELQNAIAITKKKKDKTRLMFILAQLYQITGDASMSIAFFKQVIVMHPEYEMEFYAKINLATSFDANSGGAFEIIEILKKMLKDDKNIEYFDQIYYALADIYLKKGEEKKGVDALKMSAKTSVSNPEQKGLAFYRLAQIYFEKLEYQKAQKFYDSTTTYLNSEHPDFEMILRVSGSLNELVKNIKIINEQDSLQRLATLSDRELERIINQRIDDYENELEEKEREKNRGGQFFDDQSTSIYQSQGDNGNGKWYFYNPVAITFGSSEFKRIWGNRGNEDNWRRIDKKQEFVFEEAIDDNETLNDSARVTDKASAGFYKQDIPFEKGQMEESIKKIAKAYYNLGVVYKDQLEDAQKAIEAFENLVTKYNDSEDHPASYYRLYRIFLDEKNQSKSDYYKNLILKDYPKSEYANLIRNPDYLKEENSELKALEAFYKKTYGYYNRGLYAACIKNCDASVNEFLGNIYKTKFILLKALATGRDGKKEEFVAQITDLSKAHASTDEGKEAAEILSYLKKAEEDDKQKVEEDERLKKGYEFSKDSKHTAVLIVPTEINIEKTKVAISNFNKQYFKFDELDTKAVLLNKENQMVSIKSFDDEIKAMKYYKTFTENKSYLVDINKDGLVFFVLSYENYPIFYLKKDTKEYLDFFGKNYLDKIE